MAAKHPIIRVRGLHQHFGQQHVLRGVDVDVYPGETLCLLGTSGGGKSVLLKNMLGLLEPTSGSICIDGTEIVGLSERKLAPVRKKVGMMFQNGALFDSMSVAENIAFPLREIGIKDEAEISQRVAKALDIVHMPDQQDKFPAELSGGMRKRIALARAIIDQPACVCYDEPHAGLDPVTAASIDQLINSLKTALGITNVVITHELRSVFRIADRIVFLKDGQVHWQGTPNEMKASEDETLTKFIKG